MRIKTLLCSIGAIVAGVAAGAALSIGTDTVLEMTGLFPSFDAQMSGVLLSTGMLLLATAYRTLYTVVGGYVGARLAPHHPQRHANILGALGVAANLAGLSILPDWSQAWYPILLALLAFPASWWGGRMVAR